MKRFLTTLYLSLSLILISNHLSNAEEVTTSNLLDQNFDNGSWSGTADGRHGSSIIAAHNDEYITSNDVSLRDDAGLTQDQINDGFTTNHSFKYWHWNNYSSTVQSTVTVVGSDGETTTQIRTYNSVGCGYINCGSYNTGSDTLSISRNSQTDFDVNVRYDFSDTSNASGHYGVDLKEPSLTITYESDPVRLDNSTVSVLNDIFQEVTEDLKFEEEFKFEDDKMSFEETFTDFQEFESMSTETKQEEKIEEPQMYTSDPFIEDKPEFEEFSDFPEEKEETSFQEVALNTQEKEESPSEDFPEEVMDLFPEQENDDEMSETPEEENVETAQAKEEAPEKKSVKEQKTSNKKEKILAIPLEKVMTKIDEKIKDIDKNLQAKHLVKIQSMSDNSILELYNKPFYKERKIYEDQISIEDNRIIYTASLQEYKINDPIFNKQDRINKNRAEQIRILNEIEVLRNEL